MVRLSGGGAVRFFEGGGVTNDIWRMTE